jgi:iron complex outermembrane receptor protein
MLKRTVLAKSLLIAFSGATALSGGAAFAQAATAAAPVTLQRVEITGSSIKRLAAEQSLPVTILKTEDLAKAGVTNAEQALNFIASNQSSTVTANSVGSSNGGAAYADLRGLGAARTLVLVNGKRMVNNPYSAQSVDVNALPFGSIERIEVLTDGASAIYGTDAIAGVVNFITRKEMTGFSVSADASLPQASGGGKAYSAGISGGFGSLSDQGWNVFGGLSYRKQDALAATDREFAKTSYLPAQGVNKTSGTTFPANYSQSGVAGTFNPTAPGCAPPLSLPVGAAGTCRFDYVPFINIVPEQVQTSLIAKGSFAVNKDNTVSLEYIQANNKVDTVISPTPVTGLNMQPGNPFFPGAGITPGNAAISTASPISLGWRQTEVGGRASQPENSTNRILLNWEGQYKGWDYSASAFQSKADVTQVFTGGYVNSTMIQNGLNGVGGAPYLNPFGPQTAAGSAYLQSAKILGQVQNAEGTLRGFNAGVSGEIAKLPAGPMMLAVGVEFLKDEASYNNNFALIRQAASSGLELAEDSAGSRNDKSISAELNIPITKEFDINLAIRYDKYSDFGSTTNPKASFRWAPSEALLFRGSINTGFRAPTLYDVYAPNSLTNTGNPYDDPVLCPNGVVNTAGGGVASRDCNQQFNQQNGGNKNLKPETSTAWTLGFAVQPINALTLGVDYWNYKVDDSIGPTGEEVIFGDPAKYSAQFVRCSQLNATDRAAIATCSIPGGDPLAYITNTQLNLGSYKTSGLDFTANWQGVASDVGKFSFGWKGTYVMTYEYQLEQGAVYNNNLGVYFNGNPVARYRQVMNFGWQYGSWATQLVNRYTSSYRDQNEDANGNVPVVAGNNIWDLAVTWSGVKGLALTAGMTNMFDRSPPFTNQGGGFQVGYDQRYANPIGRAFLLRGTYQF